MLDMFFSAGSLHPIVFSIQVLLWPRGFSCCGPIRLMTTPTMTKPSNQAMQLTASKPAIYAVRGCHRERLLRSMHKGLAAADLVSR
jgi:hypothetical protein